MSVALVWVCCSVYYCMYLHVIERIRSTAGDATTDQLLQVLVRHCHSEKGVWCVVYGVVYGV
jgi:hypothetical protein